MDQLLAIRVFSRVVEAGNFTKAADSLRMPKATVSKLVQTLEAHLGVQLLHASTILDYSSRCAPGSGPDQGREVRVPIRSSPVVMSRAPRLYVT
jgi:hypothetical protein